MYYILYGFLYLMSLLPMRILYILSDSIYVLLFHLIGYRKKVVLDNLRHAFPEKTEKERIRIGKDFYLNFIDNFIETLKVLSANEDFLKKHFVIENPELFDHFFSQNRKCQVVMGHNFNWEVANATMPLRVPYKFLVVYMPVTNKSIDRLFLKIRSRTGTQLLPATSLSRAIIPYRKDKYLLALVADQAPVNLEKSYWANFLNRPTPFIQAPEKGAMVGDIPVIFAMMHKEKRGYYRSRISLLSDHSAQRHEGEITLAYIRILEQSIRENPSMWLWSHRRWKHAWNEKYRQNWIDDQPPIATTF